jgi:hypothetical protein
VDLQMIDEERFFAWLDGELPPEEAARVEAEVTADPELRRRADEHRAMTARLRGAFGSIESQPLPERIAAAASVREDNVIDLGARRERRRFFAAAVPQWASMAAALVLGIALGATINRGDPAGPVEVRGGSLYAASSVDRALETQLASAASGDVRVGVTFRDQAGTICRTFEAKGSSGLACRDQERWKLRGLFAAPEGQSADYRMAAGADPRLMEMVDQSIAGEPFDVVGEKAAMERGWR